MLKHVIGGLWKNEALTHGRHGIRLSMFVPVSGFCVDKTPPRSYFGVHDYPEDEKCVPFTFERRKKILKVNKPFKPVRRSSLFMYPYSLDISILKRSVRASLFHRMTCTCVASSFLRHSPSTKLDVLACMGVGRILAKRGKEADIYTAYYRRKNEEKFEGKLRAIVQSIIDNGIDVKVYV